VLTLIGESNDGRETNQSITLRSIEFYAYDRRLLRAGHVALCQIYSEQSKQGALT